MPMPVFSRSIFTQLLILFFIYNPLLICRQLCYLSDISVLVTHTFHSINIPQYSPILVSPSTWLCSQHWSYTQVVTTHISKALPFYCSFSYLPYNTPSTLPLFPATYPALRQPSTYYTKLSSCLTIWIPSRMSTSYRRISTSPKSSTA